jgi:hypothetical protein
MHRSAPAARARRERPPPEPRNLRPQHHNSSSRADGTAGPAATPPDAPAARPGLRAPRSATAPAAGPAGGCPTRPGRPHPVLPPAATAGPAATRRTRRAVAGRRRTPRAAWPAGWQGEQGRRGNGGERPGRRGVALRRGIARAGAARLDYSQAVNRTSTLLGRNSRGMTRLWVHQAERAGTVARDHCQQRLRRGLCGL